MNHYPVPYYSPMVHVLLALMVVGATAVDYTPYLLPLKREVVPVMKNGRTVSHRSAFYGTISVGGPDPQQFSVVFDTGSGHVVVPSVECTNATCMEHRRYNISRSASGLAINSDGTPVPPDELCDQVTIGFGTGTVKGEFAREKVCMGSPTRALCSDVTIVMAVEMSEQPFRSFTFDGLFGLGLSSLSLAPEFSFFGQLAAGGASSAHAVPSRFGIFLTDCEDGKGSEIAIGGYNAARLAGPLTWAPVVKPKLGYWQVQVKAVRVDGRDLGICKNNACTAILDTGTSHLGVPHHIKQGLSDMLTVDAPAGTNNDCRSATAPALDIDLGDFTIALLPKDYMRREPLNRTNKTGLPCGSTPSSGQACSSRCTPRLMPVNMMAPLGPNLFIFGEPILHRYYTVYDWLAPRIGFGIAQKQTGTTGNEGEHQHRHPSAEVPTPPTAGVDAGASGDAEDLVAQDSHIFLMQLAFQVVHGTRL
eukprot:CAMPEP_0172751654 /NCGR_PEP_ID=MMETSP1074-20121228/152215_1 /TAXON_ID=2916 /ORGANISM="Ceratium fusus, Strain PA161109" /LENGTH=475 /DNA_ID=CAMNT_0013584045 /DNA_START=32 /DNA_END=1459 /DNA_ORIENTATION=+